MSDEPNNPQDNSATNPNKDRRQKESNQRHVYVEPGVQVDFVEGIRKKYETSQGENASHNKKVLLWTRIGAALVLLYATISAMQWWELRKNFRTEQRAWISLAHNWPDITQIKEGVPVSVAVVEGNSGKTAAKHVFYEFILVTPLNTDQVSVDYSPFHDHGFSGMVMPNALRSGMQVQRYGADQRPLLLTKEEADDLLNGRRYIAIFGQVMFEDVFGDPHWVHYCDWYRYYTNASIAGGRCTAYNDAGDGPLPKK